MATEALDALECWLREQTIASVLPKEQAKELLTDLRDDRRFWAQQRRQFATLWVSVEEGMRNEERPLGTVLGPVTSERLLDAVEAMDDDPALVNSILRSEIVEKMIGHILYEGIFEFIQRADLLGNIFNTLPIIGAIRMQMLKTARQQLDVLLGAQLSKFLGEYTASAAESAASFLISEDTASARRKAKRRAAEKLLAKPIHELVEVSDLEMALVRDAVWSAVQEFRLPNEAQLVDRLYGEFGEQPFDILLPSTSAASRGDAPLFERGRSVLVDILQRFIASDTWSGLLLARSLGGLDGAVVTPRPRLKKAPQRRAQPVARAKAPPLKPPPTPGAWDGWD